jgi:hypothetical protein
MFTPIEALKAIAARINGEFDHPLLQKIGALNSDPLDDISTIMDNVEISTLTSCAFDFKTELTGIVIVTYHSEPHQWAIITPGDDPKLLYTEDEPEESDFMNVTRAKLVLQNYLNTLN